MVASVLLITCLILVSYLFSAWYMVRTTESKLLEDYNAAMDFTMRQIDRYQDDLFQFSVLLTSDGELQKLLAEREGESEAEKIKSSTAICRVLRNYELLEATVSAWNFFWTMAASIPATVPTRILYTPQEIFRGWRNWMEWQGGIFQEDMLF